MFEACLRVCVWTDRGHVGPCRRSGGRARKEQTSAGRDGGHAPRHPEHVNTSPLRPLPLPRSFIDSDSRHWRNTSARNLTAVSRHLCRHLFLTLRKLLASISGDVSPSLFHFIRWLGRPSEVGGRLEFSRFRVIASRFFFIITSRTSVR